MNPSEIWHHTPYAHHRAAIFKALQIDPRDPSAGFSCAQYRVVANEGVTYIAGAVGCPPHLDLERFKDWTPDAISDVILWNPRTNDVRILGEAKSQTVLIAPVHAETITVYQDARAFFRAWCERRAAHYVRHQGVISRQWLHPMPEPADSFIPGAFVCGSLSAVKGWHRLSDATLLPGPGCAEDELRKSVWRSADIPKVITRKAAA